MTEEKLTILNALGIEIDYLDEDAKNFIKSQKHLPQKQLIKKLYEEKILPCTARMKVDYRNMHHKNRLAGGSSLAMAECLAGFASNMLFCEENEFATGMQVSGNHVFPAHENEILLARADIVHKGSKTHVWNVDIVNADERLISSVRVTNMIIPSN